MAARSKPTASLSLLTQLHQPRLAPDQIPMLAGFPRYQNVIRILSDRDTLSVSITYTYLLVEECQWLHNMHKPYCVHRYTDN